MTRPQLPAGVAASPCLLCRARLPETPKVCERCRARLLRQLTAIPALYTATLARGDDRADTNALAHDPVSAALPAGPVPAAATGPRVATSRAPAVPIDLDLLDLTTGPHPAATRLHDWVNRWRRLGDPPPGDPATWLAQHLDRACDEGGTIAEFAHDLAALTAELRRAAGDDRQLIGRCPTEAAAGLCGGELLADTHANATECPDCGTVWARQHWLWLADTIRPDQERMAS